MPAPLNAALCARELEANMSQKIRIHGDEWDLQHLQEDIDWARAQKWQLRKYFKQDDHTHCVICFWTIFNTDDNESGMAYLCKPNIWLCKECFAKFIS